MHEDKTEIPIPLCISFVGRFWPITMGIGVGLGMAMSNCQNKLNSTDVVRVSLVFNE